MRWDRFFEDLEDQLDSEWEAERAALDTEAERLRLSRVVLRDRLVALRGGEPVTVEMRSGTTETGTVARVGADWVALQAASRRAAVVLVPLHGVLAWAPTAAAVLASARESPGADDALSRRMLFGFVLRDLVRRRIPVRVWLIDGRMPSGTIDRAGADHLDLALHDAGVPRRADNVTGYRIVPLEAVEAVQVDAPIALL